MMDGSFLQNSSAAHVPLQQHPAHLTALRIIGAEARRIDLEDGGHANILLRRFGPLRLALVPRGPVWPDGRLPRPSDLMALRRRLPALTALIVNADAPLPVSPRLLPLFTAQWVAEWDIDRPPSELRARLHQKWRNRLCRAESADLALRDRQMPARPDHWLLRLDAAHARQKRYATWPPALIAAHAAARNARLFTAGPDAAPVAAMLFLVHGRRATYQVGWTGATGRAQDAHRLLMWHAAMTLRDRGVQRLDLGTIDTDSAPGLARFKLGTGAAARPLGPTVLAV